MQARQLIEAGRVIYRHKSGERITDKELELVTRVVKVIIPFLQYAGPEYQLVWKDMMLTLDAMKAIKHNRRNT